MKRQIRKVAALSLVAVLGAAAYPVAAHHATTMFDHERTVPIEGKVKELRWSNPHVAIVIENTRPSRGVAAGPWVVELTSPGNLIRSGWTPTAVKPGDKVTADVHPLRDRAKGGALRRITLGASKKTFTYDIREHERPDIDLDYQ